MERRAVLVVLALVMVATTAVALAGEAEHKCPEANKKFDKVDNGVRITITVKEGGDVAALRTHVRECGAKGGPEGATVAFEDVEGGIAVLRTSTDPAVVAKLQAMTGCCDKGKGHCQGHDEGQGHEGCPNHQKAAEEGHKDCPHHQSGDKT